MNSRLEIDAEGVQRTSLKSHADFSDSLAPERSGGLYGNGLMM